MMTSLKSCFNNNFNDVRNDCNFLLHKIQHIVDVMCKIISIFLILKKGSKMLRPVSLKVTNGPIFSILFFVFSRKPVYMNTY